jgi:hypothetical protein
MLWLKQVILFFLITTTVGFDVQPMANTATHCSAIVKESNLPPAVQTHEIVMTAGQHVILISQMSNSVLVKANLDQGSINEVAAYQIGKNTSGLHGLALSRYYPGKVWVTLENENALVLIDPAEQAISLPPTIIKSVQVPSPGLGPHYVGEYGNDLWASLKGSNHVLRISHVDPLDYDLFPGVPKPIFVALHPLNGLFYSSQDASSKILKIDSAAKTTSLLSIPSSVGVTPVGLISGPKGVWFVLVGNSTQGSGTLGFIDQNDNFTYFKLKSPAAQKASLLHLAFDPKITKVNALWLLATSLLNPASTDMLIRLTFDSAWQTILTEETIALPTQKCAAHRVLALRNRLFVTELSASKLAVVASKGCGW